MFNISKMFKQKNIQITLNKWRVFTFILILIQSIGIRFFQGQGFVLSIFIISLSYKGFYFVNKKDIIFIFFALAFLVICKVVNFYVFSMVSFLYEMLLVISIYLFILQYKQKISLLSIEFFTALKILVYHALIGYCIYLFFPNEFVSVNVMNKSFLHLFYVSSSDYNGITRNTGLFWEPGVFQLIANLYLFFCIKFRKSILSIIIAFFAVLSSFSTDGFIVLIINFSYFIYRQKQIRKISILYLVLGMILLIFFIPLFLKNTSNKMSGDNTSSLVRYRDFLIGIELIKESPIIGHGIFDSNYLLSIPYVSNLESDIFSSEYLKETGNMGGGYTNGILGLIAWFGLPVSFLLYFFYYKNKFIDKNGIERFLFSLIFLLSMISEPIAYTSLFLMFPFSYWILNGKVNNKNVNKHVLYLNNYCHL